MIRHYGFTARRAFFFGGEPQTRRNANKKKQKRKKNQTKRRIRKKKLFFLLMEQERRKPGRPRGSLNKAPLKQRGPVELNENSFENKILPTLTATNGSSRYRELESKLTQSLDSWTNERLMAVFKTNKDAETMENNCHFYSSSKGKLVVDNGNLQQCSLFPHIIISTSFLEQHLRTYEDVANYADFIHNVTMHLDARARVLRNRNVK